MITQKMLVDGQSGYGQHVGIVIDTNNVAIIDTAVKNGWITYSISGDYITITPKIDVWIHTNILILLSTSTKALFEFDGGLPLRANVSIKVSGATTSTGTATVTTVKNSLLFIKYYSSSPHIYIDYDNCYPHTSTSNVLQNTSTNGSYKAIRDFIKISPGNAHNLNLYRNGKTYNTYPSGSYTYPYNSTWSEINLNNPMTYDQAISNKYISKASDWSASSLSGVVINILKDVWLYMAPILNEYSLSGPGSTYFDVTPIPLLQGQTIKLVSSCNLWSTHFRIYPYV